jgi:hypothetical protein
VSPVPRNADARSGDASQGVERGSVARETASAVLATLGVLAAIAAALTGNVMTAWHTMGASAWGVLFSAGALLVKPRDRAARVLAIGALFLSLVVPALAAPAQWVGDANEYYQMLAGFVHHATPDVRGIDTLDVLNEAGREGITAQPGQSAIRLVEDSQKGYRSAFNGRMYPVHFWLASLAAAPLAFTLHVVGLHWMRAFQLLNALLIAAAFYGLLFKSAFSSVKQRVFAALWIFSPVVWYVGWPSAEVWSASLTTLAIVMFTRKSYTMAALFAGLAATQNPPILLFLALLVGAGFYYRWREGDRSRAWLVVVAAVVAFVPEAFFVAVFRTPNPIQQSGAAALGLITAQKVASIFIDLDQGVAPYAPLLLALWVVAVGLAVYRRSVFGVLLAVTAVGMAVLSASASNWNSGAVGIMRYGVWLIPVMAWLVVAMFKRSRRVERWSLAAAAYAQVAVALIVLLAPSYAPDYLHHGPVAAFALEHAPSLYRPVDEVFAERTLHDDVALSDLTSWVGYVDQRGRFRQTLIRDVDVSSVAHATGLTQDQVRARMRRSDQPGFYYFSPPR